jgi:hypothetical protein
MEVRAVYENGAISFVNPVLFKHTRVDLLVVVPDSEVLDVDEVKYQDIKEELRQLASEDKMLQKVWADLDGKYLDAASRSDSEAFAEALTLSGKY